MKKIKVITILIAPSCLLILYVLLMQSLKLFTDIFYNNWSAWLIETGLNIIIGIYLFLLCKHSFHTLQPGKVRVEYFMSILLSVICCLVTFVPAFDFNILNYFLLGCLPQFGIVAAVNLGIFSYDCCLKIKR